MSDFQATKIFLDRNSRPFITDGRVSSVEGLIAKVRLRGNPGLEDANIPPGNLVSPGDYVLLFRPEGVANWIIASSYVPDKTLPTNTKGIRRGSKMIITAENRSAALEGSLPGLRGIGAFNIATSGGYLAIFYSGYVIAQPAAASEVTLAVTATVDGISVAQHTYLAQVSAGSTAPPINEISFSELAMNVSPGQHVVGVSAALSSGPAAVQLNTTSFWAMEV